MWNEGWMEWNLNPRTGQSMSYIQAPYGPLPANVFFQVPKELFFADSRYYCCTGKAESNYNIAIAESNAQYAMALARYNCCWSSMPNYQGGNSGGC